MDTFETTGPIPTFAFGFVMSELTEVSNDMQVKVAENLPTVNIWARDEFHGELKSLREKVVTILTAVTKYFDMRFPVDKLDVVALPGFSALKPIDNLGLVVFK